MGCNTTHDEQPYYDVDLLVTALQRIFGFLENGGLSWNLKNSFLRKTGKRGRIIIKIGNWNSVQVSKTSSWNLRAWSEAALEPFNIRLEFAAYKMESRGKFMTMAVIMKFCKH